MKYIVIFIVSVALVISGYYVRVITEPCKQQAETKIVKETKTVFKYIKKPTTIEEYKEAYISPIAIETEMINPHWLRITASDGWKQSEKEIKLQFKVRQSGNWKFYVGIGVGTIATGAAIYYIKKKL